jgi:predicted RNA-binding protein with TRAM domain
LQEIEAATKRRFFLEPKPNVHLDHFLVAEQGKLETLAPKAPVEEGAVVELQPVEVGLHDPSSAVAKLDGYDVEIAGAAKLVGKKVKARIERIQPGTVFATLTTGAKVGDKPVTAEDEAEKPTRAKAAPKRAAAGTTEPEDVELEDEELDDEELEPVEIEDAVEEETEMPAAPTPAKKRTRRGSRGGKNRKRKTATAAAATNGGEPAAAGPTIHVPPPDLGKREPEPEPAPVEAVAAEPSENGAEPVKPKKKTRRGSRGGKNRRKKPAAAPAETPESS